MILILSALIPSFQQNMNVTTTSTGLVVMLGIFILMFFSLIQGYIITSFKDNNPFS